MALRLPSALFAFPCLLLFACSSQTDPSYQGEPLATVHGSIKTRGVAAQVEMDAALVWVIPQDPEKNLGARPLGSVVSRVPVQGAFPASFSLDLLAPPPLELAEPHRDEPIEVALGLIAAVPKTAGEQISLDETLGYAVQTRIIYFTHDGAPDDYVTRTAAAYKIPATEGFHLAQWTMTEEAERKWFQGFFEHVCTHEVDIGPHGGTFNAFSDADFARCTKYVPAAATCTRYEAWFKADENGNPIEEVPALSPEQSAETDRCWKMWWEGQPSHEAAQYVPYAYLDNPGMNTPVTITLGATFWEIMAPRYQGD